MKPSAQRITVAAAVAAAALLTGCSGSGAIEHGLVKDKRGHAAYTTRHYRDVVRETNCRTATTSALTQPVPGSARGSSTSSGSSGNSRKAPDLQKNKDAATPKGGSRRVCDQTRTREPFDQYHPAVWELELEDGSRTGWKEVPKETWDETEVGDRI